MFFGAGRLRVTAKIKAGEWKERLPERVTAQYFPEQQFVGLTVPKREIQSFLDNLKGVKRVIFQPNTVDLAMAHGEVEVVFDDGSPVPFVITLSVADFGFPTFPFLTVPETSASCHDGEECPKGALDGTRREHGVCNPRGAHAVVHRKEGYLGGSI